jgi:FkbM family methyltransferase
MEFGACDGSHTKLLTDVLLGKARDFSYYAFEPDPRLWGKLRDKAPDCVVRYQAAVGNQNGPATFYLSSGPGYYGSSSIKKPGTACEAWPGMAFDETTTVEVIKLDTFAWTHGIHKVDFIWSDIQGAEGDMIEGGRETLRRTRWLYTEADGNGLYEGDANADEIMALLPDFKSHGRVEGNLLLENTKL